MIECSSADNVNVNRNQIKIISAMDDMTAVDFHNIKRFAMRAIEVLLLEEKWEKLVDIGLRFSFVTK